MTGLRASPWRSVRRAFVYAIWSTAAVALIALINPFEVDQWTLDRSAAIWQRIQADDYGKSDAKYDTGQAPGRDDITIVYLDEKSLLRHAGFGLGFGLSLREHRDMLDDLAPPPAADGTWMAPQPHAIFVDIIFANIAPDLKTYTDALPAENKAAVEAEACARLPAHPTDPKDDTQTAHVKCYIATVARITHYDQWRTERQCQHDSAAKLICILRTGGVPVIFATADELISPTASPELPGTPINQALDEVALTAPAFVSTSGYELVGENKDGRPSTAAERLHTHYRLSPAAALYVANCGVEWAYTNKDCPHKPVIHQPGAPFNKGSVSPIGVQADGAVWSDAFKTPIAVKWGVGGSDRDDAFVGMIDRLHGDNLALRCRPAGTGASDFAIRIAKELAPPLFPEGRRSDCPYTHAIPYTDFDSDLITKEDRALIQRGKIVMVAGQYEHSGDWLAGPNKALPGIYYHAMALDNLIKSNAGYQKVAAPIVRGSNLSLSTGKTFVAIFALNLLSGLVIMVLNEPALDPARIPVGSWRGASRKGWRRLIATRTGRWLIRIALVPAPLMLLLITLYLFLRAKADWVVNFEAAAILLVGAGGAVELSMVALRPLLEEGRRWFRYLDIGDARLFGPDIDAPIKPGEAAE